MIARAGVDRHDVLARATTLLAVLEELQRRFAPIAAMLRPENDAQPAAAPAPEQPPSPPAPPETGEYVASRGSYRGHPTIVINGPKLACPLVLGTSKLRALQAVWPSVQTFLAEQAAKQASSIPVGHEPRQQESAQNKF